MSSSNINEYLDEIQEKFNRLISMIPENGTDFMLESVGKISSGTEVISFARGLYDKMLLYKMRKLFNDIKNNVDNRKDRETVIKNIKSNTRKRVKETNLLLMIIEQETVEEKIEYYANLSILMLNDEIDVDTFLLYIEMVNDLYTQDIRGLIQLYEDEKTSEEFRRDGVQQFANSRIAGFGYSIDPRQLVRINRTGLLEEVRSQRLGAIGKTESHRITPQAVHFVSSIRGDLTEWHEYRKK